MFRRRRRRRNGAPAFRPGEEKSGVWVLDVDDWAATEPRPFGRVRPTYTTATIEDVEWPQRSPGLSAG